VEYHQARVVVISETLSSVLTFPSQTFFRSIYIAVSQTYLKKMMIHVKHPIINRIAENKGHFAFESTVTVAMIKCADDLIKEKVNKSLETLYFKIKCRV